MAVYKIPQNVEADDKLIGPFSFRQFIYLIMVVLGIAMGWGLAQIFVPLAIIPLPIIILFGALALPLRKDQPMEVYLAAVVMFYLKPHRRLWVPDGVRSLVEIAAPKEVDEHRTKEISQSEAEQRLSYLANVADTHGWATRGVNEPAAANSPMKNDVYFAAQQTKDVLDSRGGVAQSFETMISQADAKHRQELIEQMKRSTAPRIPLPPVVDPYASLPAKPVKPGQPHYNPYPESIHQTVISPLGQRPSTPVERPATPSARTTPPPRSASPTPPPITTSEKPASPDIINLANNPDLSIETIAREAQRIQEDEKPDEVVISLH